MMFEWKAKALAIAGGAASLIFGGLALWQTFQVWDLEDQITDPVNGYQVRLERANKDLGTCRANAANLEAAIKAQGEKVALQKEQSEARVEDLNQQLDRSQYNLERAQDRAAAILAAQPEPGADVCAEALDLLRGDAP